MLYKPTVGDRVQFWCHNATTPEATVLEVHENGELDLEVHVNERVTLNKRRVPYGDRPGCWHEILPSPDRDRAAGDPGVPSGDGSRDPPL